MLNYITATAAGTIATEENARSRRDASNSRDVSNGGGGGGRQQK
jgi:hypothetical protein